MDRRFTIAGMLRRHAELFGERPMFRANGTTVTWAEHYRRAIQVSGALSSQGVRAGSRIAFLDRNSLAYFEVLFGGALLGAVNVAVNWRLSPSEMAAIIDDAGAVVLVVRGEYLPDLAALPGALESVRRVVVVGDPGLSHDHRGSSTAGAYGDSGAMARPPIDYRSWVDMGADARDPGHIGREDDVALQLYTSGTTGLPKGVMLSNGNICTVLSEAGTAFDVDETTVSLVAMPLFHIGGSGWALSGMSRGGTSVLLRDVDPREIVSIIENERVTHAFVVPAVLMAMLAVPELETADLSSLDTIFYGASPISENVLVRCMEVLGCRFAQVYGMTETSGAVVRLEPEDHDPGGPRARLLRAAGRPLPGVELRVVDPDSGAELPHGTVGEVWTRSAYNMLGYWQNPDATAATLRDDGWLRTGDAGYLDSQGYLFLHDRIKDVVISGGENIYPAEVENVLLAHPAVADAAVIGVPDERWGETVKAVVVAVAGAELDPAEVIAFCRGRLAHFKCPTSLDLAVTLPRNPSGKILKRQLREPYWQGLDRRVH